MSKSEKPHRGDLGALRVKAPPDVEVVVTSGLFKEVARGFGDLEFELPAGIHSVRWVGGGYTVQKMVRLFPGDNPVQLYENKNATEEAIALSSALAGAYRDERVASGLLLYIPWKEDRLYASFASNFRLTKGSQAPGDEVSPADPEILQTSEALVVSFSVAPGTYVLRYISVDRLVIQQTVHVYPERLTVGLLSLTRAMSAEGLGEKVHFRARDGIDPAATRMISVTRRGFKKALTRDLRLAGTLLNLLANSSDTVAQPILDVLDEVSDPYIRIFATAVLLGDMEDHASLTAVTELSQEAADRIRILLQTPNLYHDDRCAPDTECAWWRLAMSGHEDSERTFDSLTLPPMLRRSWRWATGWSLCEPGDDIPLPEIVAASVGRLSSKPWLAWRSNGSRSASESSARLSSVTKDIINDAHGVAEAFGRTLEQLDEGVSESVDRFRESGTVYIPSLDFSRLSSATKRLASNVSALRNEPANNQLALLEGLVFSMRAPLSVVAGEVQRALDEVKSSVISSVDREMSLLDPWKGQFGGRAESGGYSLVLRSWKPSNDPKWLALDVAVQANDPNLGEPNGTVRFFLHPTFNPSTQDVSWIGRAAPLICYSYGAFTLGALLDDGTRLELDLADDERLPEWFRET